MFTILQSDGVLSASDVKGVAADVIGQLPAIEGSHLDSGDIWPVVILAAVNQMSIRETCDETDDTPYDDAVMDWMHTLDRSWLEFAANLLFVHLAMTILDRSGSRVISIDFVDNSYHGTHAEDDGDVSGEYAQSWRQVPSQEFRTTDSVHERGG